jgi:capsular polysaccharide biosynthesis protein
MNSNLISNFLSFLLKKIRIVIVCAAIGAIMGLLVCAVAITPKYRASDTTAISISEEYVEDATFTYVKTQAELADALVHYFDEEYIYMDIYRNQPNTLSRRYALEEIREMFTVSNEEGTFIIQTSAVADSPKDAAILCNFYTQYTLTNTLNLIGLGYFEVVEAATEPSGSYYPSYFKGAFLGAFLAVALFCFITLAIMAFANYIITKRDLEEMFGDIPVLAEVIRI